MILFIDYIINGIIFVWLIFMCLQMRKDKKRHEAFIRWTERDKWLTSELVTYFDNMDFVNA